MLFFLPGSFLFSEPAEKLESETSKPHVLKTVEIEKDIPRTKKGQSGIIILHGLHWEKCGPGLQAPACIGQSTALNWWQAKDYCDNLKLYDKKWRLPRLAELKKLIKGSQKLARIFPGNRIRTYWTSEKFNGSDRAVRVVDLGRKTTGGELLWKSAYAKCVVK